MRRRLVVFLRTKHSGPDGTHTWVFLDDDCDLIRAYLRGVGHHAFTLVYIVLLLPATAAAIAGLVYAAVQHWGDPLVIAFIAAYALAVIVSTRFHSDDHGPIVQAARFCSYLPCWTLPPLWTYYMIEYPSWREDHWTSEEVKHNFEWWVRMWWWLLGVMSNDHPTKHALPMYPPYEWAQKYNAARHMATHLPGVSLTVSNVVVTTDTGFAIVEPYGRSWPWRCLPRVLALVHVSRGEGEDRNTGGYNLLETWVEGRKTWALAVYLAPHIAHSLKDGGWKQLAALPREALRALKEGDLVGLRAPFPSGSPLNDSKFHESALRHQLTAKVVSVDEETMRTLLAIHQLPDVQQLPDVELPAMVELPAANVSPLPNWPLLGVSVACLRAFSDAHRMQLEGATTEDVSERVCKPLCTRTGEAGLTIQLLLPRPHPSRMLWWAIAAHLCQVASLTTSDLLWKLPTTLTRATPYASRPKTRR